MAKLRNSKRFHWVLVALILVLLVGGAAVALHVRSVHNAQKASGPIPTSKKIGSTANSKDKSQQATTNQTNASSDNPKQPGSPVSTSSVLAAPFGTFVSNHKPGQDGSPSTEQSVCNTTPGATCDIQFTNAAGVTKSLGAEVADSNGTAYWSWNINGGTLAPGSWQITAVAKSNGQTKTTPDPTPLEVQ
jgi:hypothetical protein